MELLEYYHNQRLSTEKYITRKLNIPDGYINLFGVRGAGKTTLVMDLLQQEDTDTILYIDLDSTHLLFDNITTESLQKYIDKNKIKLLIIDDYQKDYLTNYPKVDRLIIISRTPLDDNHLTPIELFPLDYEEFLAFESNSSQTQTVGFNHFLRSGTLPYLAKSQKNHINAMKIFIDSSFDKNELKLLIILAQHHTKHITTNQIYKLAKEKFQISKDWLYKTIKLFQDEKIVIFIEDRYKKSGQKMLLFDFAFAKYLTIGEPFIIQFDTMIALALMKHQIRVQTLGVHGYITTENELIIPAPFESEDSLWIKSQSKFSIYKKHNIAKVTIITIANHYEYEIEKIHFEALPFDEWSIISQEDV